MEGFNLQNNNTEVTVLLLNGPSSSGKSTLAKRLKEDIKVACNKEFEIVSIDDFLTMSKEELIYEDDVFAITPQMENKITKLIQKNQGIIIDHVITSERIYHNLMEKLKGVTVYQICVTCPKEELQRREVQRENRFQGMAQASFDYLYPKQGYDITVDTFEYSLDECSNKITKLMKEG